MKYLRNIALLLVAALAVTLLSDRFLRAQIIGNNNNGAGDVLPAPGNIGNLLIDNGVAWDTIAIDPSSDICESSLGLFTLCGMNSLPFSGNPLSPTIAGQYWATDGQGNVITYTSAYPVAFTAYGPMTNGMAAIPIPVQPTLNFNADFAALVVNSQTIVPAAFGSCGTNPNEPDNWGIWCPVSGVMTQIGTATVPMNCTTNGMSFQSISHAAQFCDGRARYEFRPPATASGANLTFNIAGHR